jgi:hypothetical protein
MDGYNHNKQGNPAMWAQRGPEVEGMEFDWDYNRVVADMLDMPCACEPCSWAETDAIERLAKKGLRVAVIKDAVTVKVIDTNTDRVISTGQSYTGSPEALWRALHAMGKL